MREYFSVVLLVALIGLTVWYLAGTGLHSSLSRKAGARMFWAAPIWPIALAVQICRLLSALLRDAFPAEPETTTEASSLGLVPVTSTPLTFWTERTGGSQIGETQTDANGRFSVDSNVP